MATRIARASRNGERLPPAAIDEESGERSSALEKSLVVLEAVIGASIPIGLPDLTAELGLSRQTIHRVLQQLCAVGLLVRDPSRERYSVGPRLGKLSLSALLSRNQGAPVRSVLARLVRQVEETCNIGVLDGLDFVYLDRIEAEWSLRVHLTAGSRVPAHCTSGGKVLLAWLDEAIRDELISARELERFTKSTIVSAKALRHELVQIRAQGYALNEEEFTVGIVGAAVPVLDGEGRALGALAVHGPSSRLSLEKAKSHVPALRAAARDVARMWKLAD